MYLELLIGSTQIWLSYVADTLTQQVFKPVLHLSSCIVGSELKFDDVILVCFMCRSLICGNLNSWLKLQLSAHMSVWVCPGDELWWLIFFFFLIYLSCALQPGMGWDPVIDVVCSWQQRGWKGQRWQDEVFWLRSNAGNDGFLSWTFMFRVCGFQQCVVDLSVWRGVACSVW